VAGTSTGPESGIVSGLELRHLGEALALHYGSIELLRYVYRPDDAQFESPRPYAHPMHTLAGDMVSLYRPHDHVWHKGLALSLPNVGSENFWGGVTWVRGEGYRQLPNNGSMTHVDFDRLEVVEGTAAIEERLAWVTEAGQTWFDERRRLRVHVDEALNAWVLAFDSRFVNVSGRPVAIGSPTTQGRPNAGYGGLFWRGPRSFTGGVVHHPEGSGGDELMGVRAPWLAFTGVHDGHGRRSTIVMVDSADNAGHPTKWFVRSTPFACLCPAPFFDTERLVEPGEAVRLSHAVVVGDGDGSRASAWAELGRAGMRWTR
jgi:hypothetical protein